MKGQENITEKIIEKSVITISRLQVHIEGREKYLQEGGDRMYEYEADVANFAKYFDIYNLMRISKGATADQLKKWLISEGMPETSARRHLKEFTEDYDGWLYDYDEETEEYTVSKYGMEYFIKKLAEWSEIKIYDQEAYDAGSKVAKDKVKQLKDEMKEMEKNHLEMQALCHSQQKYIEQLNASIERHQDKIVNLSTRLGISETKVKELESEKAIW